jgi:anti-sigma factor (TIGR02949 family)
VTLHQCRDRARLLSSYLDGELEASKMLEIDEHVDECETCGEEAALQRAVRGSLKRVVRSAAPVGLRERMATAMAAERSREDARADAEAEALGASSAVVSLSSWKTMVPLATAAALALFWGAATRGAQPHTYETRAGFGDDLLSQFVADHASPLPPEATNADAVRSLERYVGVPVRPGSFERGGAHLVGARVVPLQTQRAAMLQYVVGTGDHPQRVSVLVYDAQKIQISDANLTPRAVGTAEVRMGSEHGYAVAAAQRAGVGYLVASDLDPDRNAQLAAMVYEDR